MFFCRFVKSIYWVSFAFWEMYCLLEFVFCFALRDQAQQGGLVPTDNEQPAPFQKNNSGSTLSEKNQVWFVFFLSLESDSDCWVKRDDDCTENMERGRCLPRKVLPRGEELGHKSSPLLFSNHSSHGSLWNLLRLISNKNLFCCIPRSHPIVFPTGWIFFGSYLKSTGEERWEFELRSKLAI